MLNNNTSIWNAISEIETNAIILIDKEGYVQKTNKGLTAILGFSENDIIGKSIEIILPKNIRDLHRSLFENYTESRKKEDGNQSKIIGIERFFPELMLGKNNKFQRFSALHKNQTEVPISITINEIWSDSNDLIGFIAIISNNTEQYNLQSQLRQNATHDQLTGLISWQEFYNKVQATKNHIQEKNSNYHASLLFCDIDYFKAISFHSQKAGDSALKKFSSWFINQTRQKDNRFIDIISTRFFSDEFVVFLPGTSVDEAMTLACRLKSNAKKVNLRTADNPFFTTISIGISEISSTTKLQDAVSQASNACTEAKEKGKDKIVIAQDEFTNDMQLESIIRQAIKTQRLKLYAQKIVDISPKGKSIDNNPVHYEVLVRMVDTQGQIILPTEFIPAAENIGLAIAIDKYVIEQTFSTLRNNSEHEKALSLCSINLSGVSAANEQMLPFIEEKIRHYDIKPSKICFEITETHQITDNFVALNLVSRLRSLGCKFSFDDFGIGYSNYQSFSRLPVDIIKIDGYYVRNALKNNQLRTDMEGIINSAKSRGLKIVGEFAESAEIIEELVRLGVDYAQGYHFSKPVPLDTLINEMAAVWHDDEIPLA